jgi:hypothetical protein
MRLFGKKSPTSLAAEAEAEAEAEIRRAAEALGLPLRHDDAAGAWPPPPVPVSLAEEELPEEEQAPVEADVPWEESGTHEHDDALAGHVDPLPEDAQATEPPRRRVRKTPPRAAASGRRAPASAGPSRSRTSGRSSGAGGA